MVSRVFIGERTLRSLDYFSSLAIFTLCGLMVVYPSRSDIYFFIVSKHISKLKNVKVK